MVSLQKKYEEILEREKKDFEEIERIHELMSTEAKDLIFEDANETVQEF